MLGQFYGFTAKQTNQLQKLTGINNPFQGLPTAAQSGEFNEIIPIAGDYFNPREYTRKNRFEGNMAGQGLAPSADSDYYYIDKNGNYVDRSVYRQSYDIDDETGELIVPGMVGPQEGESSAPAPLTVVPTSTSNPERPRTVAAGYDAQEQKITVVFRDGTFYNYYEVSPTEWTQFKSRVSKGK